MQLLDDIAGVDPMDPATARGGWQDPADYTVFLEQDGDRQTTPAGVPSGIGSALRWPAAVVPIGYSAEVTGMASSLVVAMRGHRQDGNVARLRATAGRPCPAC